ncbi:MAG TPA: cytochrome P450, partial [Frankiaceae bacterium]|nr:cytochrome P450 [Frankiaceae bacterium]
MADSSVPDYDFFDPSVRDDPHPFFARIRENDPVLPTPFGYWYVTRYDDAVSLLRDPAMRSGRGVPDSLGLSEGPLRLLMDTWMMSQDGAAHTRVRKLISRAFTPRAVEALRPAV